VSPGGAPVGEHYRGSAQSGGGLSQSPGWPRTGRSRARHGSETGTNVGVHPSDLRPLSSSCFYIERLRTFTGRLADASQIALVPHTADGYSLHIGLTLGLDHDSPGACCSVRVAVGKGGCSVRVTDGEEALFVAVVVLPQVADQP
jgi:hypothetical protein